MRVRAVLVSLLVSVGLVGSGLLTGAAPASATTTVEAQMVASINVARARYGLKPLRVSRLLSSTARAHTGAMTSQNALFHTPTFTTVCCWRVIAENVGFGGSVRTLHRAFMASPQHRANVLNRRVREVGVGIVNVNGQLWVTELFRQPMR